MIQDVPLSQLEAIHRKTVRRRRRASLVYENARQSYLSVKRELTKTQESLSSERDRQDDLRDSQRADKKKNRFKLARLRQGQKTAAKQSERVFRSAINLGGGVNSATIQQVLSADCRHALEMDNYLTESGVLEKSIRSLKSATKDSAKRINQLEARTEKLEALSSSLKSECEILMARLRLAKTDCAEANEAVKKRKEEIKTAGLDREKPRTIAKRAGVPKKYHNKVYIKRRPEGDKLRYDIYFGGSDGGPFGPGHGHYTMIGSKVAYRRNPITPT